MTVLLEHIKYLLLKRGFVRLPEIGLFEIISNPAFIDQKHNTIIPPSSRIIFNSIDCYDDGILAISLARKNKIEEKDAISLLSEKIDNILNILNNGQKIKLGNLGFLSMSQRKIDFTPSYNNLNTGYYNIGLD